MINWEPFTDPFKIYNTNIPITNIETGSCDILGLISYQEFDKIMTDYIDKYNRYAGNTEESISIQS